MKILLLIHSKTGNCYSLGQQISQDLTAAGHTVDIVRLKAEPDNAVDPKLVKIRNLPDLQDYDALVIGAPVRAFNASAVMQAAVAALHLEGKRLALFVTMYMPFNWLGGKQALESLGRLARNQKNGFELSQIIRLPLSARSALIADFRKRLQALFA